MAEVLTSDVILDIRNADSDAMAQHSVYAACLLPLIGTLESQITPRDVAEALPHYAFEFDLDALRSILARLGYKTEEHSIKISSLEAKLTPCLYIDKDNTVYVIYQKTGDQFVFFNASTGATSVEALEGSGRALFLTYYDTDKALTRVKSSWFWDVIARFRPIFKHLLGMSLVLNLTTLAVPVFIMVVYDFVIGKQNIDALGTLSAAIVLILGVDLFLRLVRSRILAIPAGRIEYLLSTESLRQILSLPSAMTERSSVTIQLSKLRLYDSIRDFFTGPSALLTLELPFLPIYIGVIAVLGGNIVIVPLVAMAIFGLLGLVMLPKLKRAIETAGESRTAREQLLLETLSGILEIKSMGEEDGWLHRFREASANTLKCTLNASQLQIIANYLTQAITLLAAVGVVALGGSKAIEGELSVGALIAIMALLWRVVGPMQGVFLTYVQYTQIGRGIKGLDELMALKPERKASKSALLKKEYKGDIKFERVGFRYTNQADPVLLGASFHIPANELVVVAGENGSGKSTILKLLCGMYYAQMGNIYIDDAEIRQLNVVDLRRVVGYVPQHPRLFYGDIRQNLRLYDILATDEELQQAAADAGILERIQNLPDGFNTSIGFKAANGLPSGLERGICVARAFVRKTPIILLDEPGTGQDKTHLRHFIKQLEAIKGKKTIIIVSHIPAIIKLADKVIELDRGLLKRIVTPDEYLQYETVRGAA